MIKQAKESSDIECAEKQLDFRNKLNAAEQGNEMTEKAIMQLLEDIKYDLSCQEEI